MSDSSSCKVLKLLSIGFLCSIIAILLISWDSPATEYESSIYCKTPLCCLIILGITLICSIGMVTYQIHSQKPKQNSLWLVCLFLIFLIYAILQSLWIIRGYSLLGFGDSLSHLGITQSLLYDNHTDSNNYYPILHIYAAIIANLLNIATTTIMKYF